LITHCIAESVVSRSPSIRGSATLTTDSSMKAIVDPSTAAASTHDLRLAHAGTPGLERITPSSQGNAFGLANQCGYSSFASARPADAQVVAVRNMPRSCELGNARLVSAGGR